MNFLIIISLVCGTSYLAGMESGQSLQRSTAGAVEATSAASNSRSRLYSLHPSGDDSTDSDDDFDESAEADAHIKRINKAVNRLHNIHNPQRGSSALITLFPITLQNNYPLVRDYAGYYMGLIYAKKRYGVYNLSLAKTYLDSVVNQNNAPCRCRRSSCSAHELKQRATHALISVCSKSGEEYIFIPDDLALRMSDASDSSTTQVIADSSSSSSSSPSANLRPIPGFNRISRLVRSYNDTESDDDVRPRRRARTDENQTSQSSSQVDSSSQRN